MRIALLSDFHLGYDRFREDARRQAEEALELASQLADVLLIPGDIFDNRSPSPDVLAEAINIFRELSKRQWKARVVKFDGKGETHTEIPVIAIPGTHERRAQNVEDPVDLLGLAGLLVDVSQACAVVEKDGERVAIRGIGGISEERFKEVLKAEDPRPVDGAFNVFMFHQSVYELLPFSQDFIRADELPDGFDLYVNGHIHSRFEGRVHGKPFLISGSTVLTQLKEGEQEQKGFFVFDTSTMSYNYNRINCRRFVHRKIEIEAAEPARVEEEIRKVIEEASAKGDRPIIRIEVDGKLKKGFKNVDLNLSGLAKDYEDKAIVEISRKGVENAGIIAADSKRQAFDNVSVKDYGLGIFLERLRHNEYDMSANPTQLFELLSSEGSKEKIVKGAMDSLFNG